MYMNISMMAGDLLGLQMTGHQLSGRRYQLQKPSSPGMAVYVSTEQLWEIIDDLLLLVDQLETADDRTGKLDESDAELPGMWEAADFLGGAPDLVRGPDPDLRPEDMTEDES